jgi:antibiotic biosynthesis monooxygenase (ABM) superfamily enzyme
VSEPVTVIVTRTVKAGKVQEFEEWIQGITGAVKKFAGYMGSNVIRPDSPSLEYVVIFRFESYESLEKWQKSHERKAWIEKVAPLVEGEPKVEVQAGLEFWFTPRPGARPAPKHKMALVIIPVISALLLTLVPLIRQATEGLPDIVRTVAGVAIMVVLMTYVIMPAITRAIAPWLYKKSLA